ncbi:uncharacterized protein LOC119168440 [Rhipicephalus microplus]|uniref:uncharacterized protein LOC119168440 n=1 Tax=Rhipicephalus microplus TaxID=6941 RepID=UPI003F6CFA22
MTCLKCQKKTPGSTENTDITRFYDKNGVIWTLETTEPTTIRCKFDVVNKSTHHGVRLMRQYYWIGSRTNFYLDGTFISKPVLKNTYNAMRITEKESVFKSIEQLLFAYQDYACGIFKVTLLHPDQMDYLELRVKESILSEPKRRCIEKFVEHSKGAKITPLYSSACRTKLKL